jgi:hypothetical protein
VRAAIALASKSIAKCWINFLNLASEILERFTYLFLIDMAALGSNMPNYSSQDTSKNHAKKLAEI